MDYRLTDNLPGTGVLGQVFDSSAFKAIPYFNKALFEPVLLEGYYPLIFLKTHGNRCTKYLLSDMVELVIILDTMPDIEGWIKSGIVTAATEHRPYKYYNDWIEIKLLVNPITV